MAEDIKTKIQTIFDQAHNQGKVDVLEALISPDYQRHQPPMKPVIGLEAYLQFIKDVRSAYSGFRIDVEEIIVAGDKSVTRLVLSGKHTGQAPTLQAAPTGKQIEMRGCVVSTWQNGKIVHEWVYNDYLGLVQQFGVIPLPGLFA